MSEGGIVLFYLTFRFWFGLGLRVYACVHAWMPTNHLIRWVNTDRGIKWGLILGTTLTPLYYLAMIWSGDHLGTGGSGWWWLPTVWAAMNAIKFAHVAIRSPFAWVYRTVRHRTTRRVYRRRPAQ